MRIMISCGEPSGDLYAGALAGELMKREPSIEVFGFGSERLRAARGRLVGDFSGISVTGLTEALRVLPRSYAMFRRLISAARATRPDVFVAIDFPDFNFRLMAALKRLGIPVVYYVSPQLWAWRPGRMKTMKALVDRVLVIFPFEEELYLREGLDVKFVGHPLVDLARATTSREVFLREHGLDPAAPTVALLPGSRRNELHRILPDMAAAIPLIRAHVPNVQFVVACAPNLPEDLFALVRPGVGPAKANASDHRDVSPDQIRKAGPHHTSLVATGVSGPVLVRGRTDDVLAASDVVVTASGTATVQAALHEKPMVVVYRLSDLTYRLGKPFVKVDTYAMANLVAGRTVVPELIQHDFTPQRVAEETVSFLTDRARYESTRHALREVRARLGAPGASGRAAEAILEVAARGLHERRTTDTTRRGDLKPT
jgi:lipid-A-disaccharide synthase